MPVSKTIEETMRAINKTYGNNAIARLGDDPGRFKINLISTGSLKLDRILGGGIPQGRTVEIYGPEASGKTSLLFLHMAEVQKTGRLAAYIDVEKTFNPDLAASYGVDVDNLFISKPTTGEEAIDIAEALIRTGEFGIVGIDSVSALIPEAEEKADMKRQSVGEQARLMSKGLRKLTGPADYYKCTVVFINQIREKVGVIYGNPETTSGGRALRFFASVRLEVRSGDKLKHKDFIVGHVMRVKVVKNKVGFGHMNTEFNIFYGVGIDRAGEIADIAVHEGLVHKAAAWLSVIDPDTGEVMLHPETGEPLKWQGLAKMQDAFRTDKWLNDYFTEKIKSIDIRKTDEVEAVSYEEDGESYDDVG